MLYFAQVILYTAAMLLIYLAFLKNRPVYSFSRFYLIACGVAPVLIPFIRLPQVGQKLQQVTAFQADLPAITVGVAQRLDKANNNIPGMWLIYCGVAGLMLLWQAWQLYRMLLVTRNNDQEKRDGFILIRSCGYGPGSFGNYIFLPGQEINETILAHEQAHIRLRHTSDIVFLNIVQALLWPNILLIWIRKELRQVHEFQADAAIRMSKQDYAQLLLQSVFNTSSIHIMHLFIDHPIKRRIMMLQKKSRPSITTKVMVSAAFAVITALGVSIQSCSKKMDDSAASGKNNNTGKMDPLATQILLATPPGKPKGTPTPDKDGIYVFADKMPEPGYNYQEFLMENIHYPEYARKNNIKGKVIVRFIVDENGNIKNVKCLRSVDTSLDNEAIRVVSIMPTWHPGTNNGAIVPVYYTLPIVFQL